MRNFTLNNGLEIPELGFGTYKADLEAIKIALENGVKYFDTASFYNTEKFICEALKLTGKKREEIFIASKIWKNETGYENALAAFNRTLENLETDYLDVYMIHWPDKNSDINIETWRAMEELYFQGKIKALGLSNFLPYHAEEIIKNCKVFPSVAQLEFHAGHTQTFALNYFREKKILLQAWSPLARGRIFDDVLICSLSEKYNVSKAQICLRFCLQEGVMPLPRVSLKIERLQEYFDSLKFEISPEDISRIENMPPLGWGGEHPDRERAKI